jgi:UDP-N-acetylglucosamine 2-epimerase (non-hydrolysing)
VISADVPLVFPVHPRTRAKLEQFGLAARVAARPALRLVDPIGYLDFLKLMAHARIVLTDSGGIQEETTCLGVPCLTLRENTERPVTVELGTNRLVGQQPDRILAAYREATAARGVRRPPPPLWDGGAAGRIVAVLREML